MFKKMTDKVKSVFRSDLNSPTLAPPVGYMNRKQKRTYFSLARKRAMEPRRRKYEKRGVKRGR